MIEGRRFSDISVVSIFLNVAHMENASNGTSFASMFSARVYSEIAQELGYSSSLSHDALCTRLVSARSRGKHIFVVIDEVDLLLNAKHTSSRECEIFLHNMFAWSTRPDMAFSLICISNYTDDKSLKNLKGLDITQVSFLDKPLSENDIFRIFSNPSCSKNNLVSQTCCISTLHRVTAQRNHCQESWWQAF